MSKTLILGGEGKHNSKWVNEMSDQIPNSYAHNYEHWGKGDDIDFHCELSRLQDLEEHGFSQIVAKSAGTILALKGIESKFLKPENTVLIGIPIKWAMDKKRDLFGELVRLNNLVGVPKTYIQQINDPECSSAELRAILRANETIHEIGGVDHWHGDYDEILTYINK